MSQGRFKRLAISAAKIELVAYASGQILRFGSGLLLSRLLFPEAFGLSVIVGLVSQGLLMVSNVGTSESIVQNPKGDRQIFLDTAWTILAARGFLVWLAACALAYPLSLILHQPELVYLVPVGSLGVLIAGFSSTGLYTLRRNLNVLPLIKIELSAQLLVFVCNVILAWTFRSVWALIASSLIGALFSTAASHTLKVGYRNRFHWDKESRVEIYNYGRWIQASSALSFASSQADKFLIAHYASMVSLGVFNFAAMIADALSAAVIRLTHGVLFPVFSQINRDSPTTLSNVYYKIRLRIDLVTQIPMGVIAASSHQIIGLLFDARYSAAGWMLQALCLRAAMTCMLAPVETFLFSIGRTQYGFYRDLSRCLWVLPGIPIGWHFFGIEGIVWVTALSELPVMIVLFVGFRREATMRIWREAVGPVLFLLGAIGAMLVLHGYRAVRT